MTFEGDRGWIEVLSRDQSIHTYSPRSGHRQCVTGGAPCKTLHGSGGEDLDGGLLLDTKQPVLVMLVISNSAAFTLLFDGSVLLETASSISVEGDQAAVLPYSGSEFADEPRCAQKDEF